MELNELTQKIIGCAIEVHKNLGPGMLESTYEECLKFELEKIGMKVEQQKELPLIYKGLRIEKAYKLDLLVENKVIVELKSVEKIKDIHKAQLLTYLKLTNKELGLLINFNVDLLKDGVTRLRNKT
jgi:GxxExxY protein